MKRLAEFVKRRRKEVNLTQENFAERAGVALTLIRKIEQGKTNTTKKIPSIAHRDDFYKHGQHSDVQLFECSKIENTVSDFFWHLQTDG